MALTAVYVQVPHAGAAVVVGTQLTTACVTPKGGVGLGGPGQPHEDDVQLLKTVAQLVPPSVLQVQVPHGADVVVVVVGAGVVVVPDPEQAVCAVSQASCPL
ncbi:MAG TPA: hypothetical protein VH682_30445 [Gemmataceae bacterium]|jgi:hypothetical protein